MSNQKSKRGFTTAILHSDRDAPIEHGALHKPLHLSVAYGYRDARELAAVFQGKAKGYAYGRQGNPTAAALEAKVTGMEGGIATVAFATGMAAIGAVMLALLREGDHVVASQFLFGNTVSQFGTLAGRGMPIAYVDATDVAGVERALTAATRMVFVETIANPRTQVADLARIGALCAERGILYVVDNTMTSPWLFRPKTVGAGLVVNALTKYIGGHGNSLGGMIVDSGNFPWAEHPDRYPMLTQPEPAYHGVVYTETFGPAAYIARARTVPLRNTGSAISPLNAFLIIQGIETLALRMERHVQNAMAVAEYLKGHDQVAWVHYAGLPDSPYFELAQKYTKGRPSGLLSFGVKGGYEPGVKFYDALKVFKRLVNIGDVRSLAAHPASTTHRQMTEAEQATANVTPDTIRLCVGIEHIDDILADLEQALAASAG